MLKRFLKNPYKASLQESAKLIAPKDETCDKILGSVLVAAGVATASSFASASAKAASMGKVAFVKSVVGVAAAATASVTVATVAGVTTIAPPAIRDIQVIGEGWTACDIVVDVNRASTRSVMVTPPGGEPFAMARGEDGQYTITVSLNGVYQVEASGNAGRSVVQEITVSGIDDQIPLMTRYEAGDDTITIYFTDSLSGVRWDTAIAVDHAGNNIEPLRTDEQAGFVVFPLAAGSLDVFVEDHAGNVGKTSIAID